MFIALFIFVVCFIISASARKAPPCFLTEGPMSVTKSGLACLVVYVH